MEPYNCLERHLLQGKPDVNVDASLNQALPSVLSGMDTSYVTPQKNVRASASVANTGDSGWTEVASDAAEIPSTSAQKHRARYDVSYGWLDALVVRALDMNMLHVEEDGDNEVNRAVPPPSPLLSSTHFIPPSIAPASPQQMASDPLQRVLLVFDNYRSDVPPIKRCYGLYWLTSGKDVAIHCADTWGGNVALDDFTVSLMLVAANPKRPTLEEVRSTGVVEWPMRCKLQDISTEGGQDAEGRAVLPLITPLQGALTAADEVPCLLIRVTCKPSASNVAFTVNGTFEALHMERKHIKLLGRGTMGKVVQVNMADDPEPAAMKMFRYKQEAAHELAIYKSVKLPPHFPRLMYAGYVASEDRLECALPALLLRPVGAPFYKTHNSNNHSDPGGGGKGPHIIPTVGHFCDMVERLSEFHAHTRMVHLDPALRNFILVTIDGIPMVQLIDYGSALPFGTLVHRGFHGSRYHLPDAVREDIVLQPQGVCPSWDFGMLAKHIYDYWFPFDKAEDMPSSMDAARTYWDTQARSNMYVELMEAAACAHEPGGVPLLQDAITLFCDQCSGT